MRHYIIDGFNLFHAIREIADSTTPRRDLISYIRSHRLTGSMANRVTIVFDGFETAELHTDAHYHVIFSGNRSADDVIKDIVRSSHNRREIIVVSDDLDIRTCARGEGCDICRTADFTAEKTRTPQSRAVCNDRKLRPSRMIEITDELKKIWLK